MEKLAEIFKEKLSKYTPEELEERFAYFDKLYDYVPTIEDNINDQCEPMIALSKAVEWMENNLPSKLNYLTGTVELSSLINIFKSDMISECSDDSYKALQQIEELCEDIDTHVDGQLENITIPKWFGDKLRRLVKQIGSYGPNKEAFRLSNGTLIIVDWRIPDECDYCYAHYSDYNIKAIKLR